MNKLETPAHAVSGSNEHVQDVQLLLSPEKEAELARTVEEALREGWVATLYERARNPAIMRQYLHWTKQRAQVFDTIPEDFAPEERLTSIYLRKVEESEVGFRRVNPLELLMQATNPEKQQELIGKVNQEGGEEFARVLFGIHYSHYNNSFGIVDIRFPLGALFMWNTLNGVQLQEKHYMRFEAHERSHVLEKIQEAYGAYVGAGFRSSVDPNTVYGTVQGASEYAGIGSWSEVRARMSELKCYFGFSGNEQFTAEHLYYAQKHYEEDVGINDPYMSRMLNSVLGEKIPIFLWAINTLGV